MAGQLIYTSAPQGLAAGQSGYCTVARDGDLREALIRPLEQLSSYHRATSGGQTEPVISAYRILDLRGAKYHVLSRIQDAGLDFTNRTNNLAHHLVFEPHEIANLPLPALIFRDWNGWRKEWKEAPRFLGPSDWGNLSQLPCAMSLPAKNWESVTGDAGSAAGLLERGFANGAYFLASAEVLLLLFAESVQLLTLKGKSRADFWEYTFTTRLQPEDNPNDFRWRGCQRDSPAYQAAVRKGASFTAANSIKAPANDLAQYARTGKLPTPVTHVKTPIKPGISPATSPSGPPSTRPATVPLRGWDPAPSSFEEEHYEEEAQEASHSRWMSWISLLVMLVIVLGSWAWYRSHKLQRANAGNVGNKGTNSSRTNLVSVAVARTAPPEQTNSAQHPPPDTYKNRVDHLPEFTTYLVALSSDNRVSVESIADLNKVCDQLKKAKALTPDEFKAIMECRIRSNDPLSADESPTDSMVSFRFPAGGLRGENSLGLGFAFDGWRSLNLPQTSMAVIDFSSTSNQFKKFRIVTFPLGTTNQPVKFPKSLLQADQSSFDASFKAPLASRIAKLEMREAFLQLRPFVKINDGVRDMIDALPATAKSATKNGNELNFDKLRKLLNEEAKRLEDQTNSLATEIANSEGQRPGLSVQINSQKADSNKSPDDQGKKDALMKSQDELIALNQKIDSSKKRQQSDNKNIFEYRRCLDSIPIDLKDSKLNHVALYFVQGSESKPGERVELIRFEDPAGALEGTK